MTDSDAPTRHGRRARRLTPEEEAAQQARATSAIGDGSAAPAARGAVAPPGADAPLPRLRKFGRRARIIELADPVDAEVVAAPADGPSTDPSAHPTPEARRDDDAVRDAGHDAAAVPSAASAPQQADPAAGTATATATAASTVPVDRDSDGVELGEMSVSEAPDPRPAPRFEGKVLQRADDSGGRSLLWVVWVLIGLAVLALIILLATGVLGPGDTGALGALAALPDPHVLDLASIPYPTPLEVTSA
ncbi:hypothetical protein M4D54_00435 [Brachybacterium sp. p3-SID1565]|uniref:hypothetical protein n=1 Tax=Brachybacterium sp. p3-SID1565 TaxID=2916046 RepID=UPI0021A91CF9|nr:hypothetical protein [Brachybacterium sp. p3-SID1565]MCT1384111.1 hypothetical protein [Brachybacterium sp. p3-SID1565]